MLGDVSYTSAFLHQFRRNSAFFLAVEKAAKPYRGEASVAVLHRADGSPSRTAKNTARSASPSPRSYRGLREPLPALPHLRQRSRVAVRAAGEVGWEEGSGFAKQPEWALHQRWKRKGPTAERGPDLCFTQNSESNQSCS